MTSSPSAQRQGCLFVVSGPSGTGKSTLCRRLLADDASVQFSVSCTTRPPRTGEEDGVHYHFISRDVFEQKIKAGEFLEYADVYGNYYGTMVSKVMARLNQGKDVLLEIDVQGAVSVMQSAKGQPWEASLVTIFVGPPSLTELEKRLRGRATDSEEVIQRRMQNSTKELDMWHHYQYLVINSDLDEAYCCFRAIFASERQAIKRMGSVPPWTK